jgi:hypothetical protein
MSVSFTYNNPGPWFGGNVLIFRNSGGIGASASLTSTTPIINLTTTNKNSAIVTIVSDWTSADGSSRQWLNSPIEVTYYRNSAHYMVTGSIITNSGNNGIKTLGLTGLLNKVYSIIAIEIKGK